MRRLLATSVGCVHALLLGACTSVDPYDYEGYLAQMPRSILVLPPLDETPEVEACYGWLSTATIPLAEAGYYVFPVGLVDRILKENGRPTAGEMHQVSLAKLREVFDADAVLYVTVTDWGTTYQVINSSTTVAVDAKLVATQTGAVLWQGGGIAQRNSSSGNNSLLGMAVSALVNQVVTSTFDPSREVAAEANGGMFFADQRGLILGPLHPDHEESVLATQELMAED